MQSLIIHGHEPYARYSLPDFDATADRRNGKILCSSRALSPCDIGVIAMLVTDTV